MNRQRVLTFCGPAALLCTLVVDAPAGLEPPAWRMLGVAAWMAVWWMGEVIPLAGTALLPMVLFPLCEILSSGATAREYGNHLVYLFLGGFLIAIAMERWELHRRIALQVLLAFGTKTRRLLTGFALTVALLSMWISNTSTALMILPVAMAVVRHLARHAPAGLSPSDCERELGPVFMLTVAYAASAGGIATLVGTPPNIVLAGAISELVQGAPTLSFARWMLLGVPASAGLLLLVLWWVPRLAASRPLSDFDSEEAAGSVLRDELDAMGPMTRPERGVLAVFLSTVFLWLTRSPLSIGALTIPGWSNLFPSPGDLHDATVAIAAGVVLMAARARPREGEAVPLLDWETAAAKLPWGVLLLFGGGFALAKGFSDTGLSAWIGDQLAGMAGAPLPLLILGVCLVTTFLTELTSNTATSTILMPVLAATAVAVGVPAPALMIPAALSASCAFMLPVATPPNAIVFGSGWVTIRQMSRVGLAMNLSGAVVITLLSWWLVPLVTAGH